MACFEKLKEDLSVWCKWMNKPFGFRSFLYFFVKYTEFKVLVDFRLKHTKWSFLRIFTYYYSLRHNLYISVRGGIGGGLRLMHGFSTIVFAKSIGKNCLINQQVTIGWANGGEPMIGDNVWIASGAKVLGPIKIGNDVIIGANAVVVKDVPNHSVVVGVPAKVIKKRTTENDIWKNVNTN